MSDNYNLLGEFVAKITLNIVKHDRLKFFEMIRPPPNFFTLLIIGLYFFDEPLNRKCTQIFFVTIYQIYWKIYLLTPTKGFIYRGMKHNDKIKLKTNLQKWERRYELE